MPYYPKMAYRTVDLEGRLRAPTGLGELVPQAWCSTANRQGSCRPPAGICLPMDLATLEVFKDLQRQTNRILAKIGRPAIGVDGRIGPGTVLAVEAAMVKAGATTAMDLSLPWAGTKGRPCDQVARYADQIAQKLSRTADWLVAPRVADPSSSRPSQPTTSGSVLHPSTDVIVRTGAPLGQGVIEVFKSPIALAGVAVFGLLLYKSGKGVRKGARRASARRPRARRRGR